ncbi:MAG: biopolymer transporter ExbB [Sphingobacteriales bacterium SCN 48-20]|jgi:biopolymer transport protein ExbB|uniref:MotA/TolQ/ExbB proton channel family protein n=1 Tax=Terrimonas ferruginea TaxID=249 RepID=UPI0008692584|nr:MotA/TolQ/ExbB proton channel family protein [Terrimonas ferruginea]MBN8784225.1 MotA/TolQ/ExbB proton channel family protein [Terrimonas ferruginea]ODT92931.1 MAG: biopolymer transporter ExbB [Sphingobacteriales bacterium SCN 48-20]OJW39177.1 MAG: biopolymer transporter ExbB [Sphingobacteriales bacterium 48-107]
MFDLLQITDSVQQLANNAVDADKNKDGAISIFELVFMGGWIMVPLGLMLLFAIYVFIERYIAIKHASRIDQNFMNIIRDHIVNGNIAAARSFARNTNNPVARIIDKGIQRIGKPIDAIERSMDNVGQLEMYKLEKNLGVLSVVSKAAPIFGFVGTLIGLMQLFSNIHDAKEVQIEVISQGIYTKLITSITGLVIGLLAYLAYNFLNTQIDKTANKMELASSDFLDVLQEPTR